MATELKTLLPGKQGDERLFVATQWQLMWWKFRKHKMAMVCAVIILLLYLVALFAEFVGPYDPEQFFPKYKLAPPTKIHLVHEGKLQRPFVYHIVRTKHPVTLRDIYDEDTETMYPIRIVVKSSPYEMWGLWDGEWHLFGLDVPHKEQGVFLLGADRLGRDLFTRLCYGARLSLSIGLVGVLMSLVIGVLLGGVSGYYGGVIDTVIQRIIEFLRTIPAIPLWMSLSAAVPADWPVVRVYFGITVILSLIGWTGMARVVRGRFLALREEDFVMAAQLAGSGELRIIVRHMAPSMFSHIIASLTLSIPNMILSETGLSFVGLGLRPPAISWGVLLQEAQNLRSLVLAPWVLLPGIAVIISVLAFNYFGDGVRDAADPYAR